MSKIYRKWPIALVLLMGLFIGFFLLQSFLKHKIEELVQEKITAPNRFSYGQMELSLYPGRLVFRDVSSDLYLREKGRNLHTESSEIRIEGISWLWLALFKELDINRLSILEPSFVLSGQPSTDTLPPVEKAGEDGLKSVQIDRIDCLGGRFELLKNEGDSLATLFTDSINLDIRGFKSAKQGKNAPFKFRKFDFSLRNFVFYDEEKVHEISFQKIDVSSIDSLISMEGLRVKPRYDDQAFFKQLKYKKDRLDLRFPAIEIQGWRFDEMLKGAFYARTATINDFALDVLSDANMPLDPNGYKPLPQEALREAKFGITLDSIVVKGGKIAYSANMPGKTTVGQLVFDPVSAVFLNVTNDSVRIAERPLMEISVRGDFDKKHRLANQFFMDLASPDYVFSFKGQVSTLPFTAFNDFLTPSAGVLFQEGTINNMEYEVNADAKVANGELKMTYEGLKFQIINLKNENKPKFFSNLIALFAVKDNNKKGSDDFREGNIQVERETQRSFFRFWWIAIQDGMKNSILKDFALKQLDKKAAEKPK